MPSEPKILRVGLTSLPSSFDPSRIQDRNAETVLNQVFETPFRLPDRGHEPVPVLFDAPLVRSSGPGGGEVWSAQIRRGVRFSDGTELTAERMAATLGETDVAARARIEPTGERISFHLPKPDASFPQVLAAPSHGVPHRVGGALHGTGPFAIADADASRVRLVRNPHYRTAVALDEVHFVHFPPDEGGTVTKLRQAIESGEIHFTDALSRDEVRQLTSARKIFQPGNSTAILFFNTQRIADRRVRRALAQAIDRTAIARLSYDNALAFTATGVLPPMFGAASELLPHSLRAAKEALAAAAGRPPARLTLLQLWAPRPYAPHPSRTSAGIVEQIGKLGITVDVSVSRSFVELYDSCRSGEFDMVAAGWIADTPNAADYLSALLDSTSIPEHGKPPGSRINISRYASDAMDRALAGLRRSEPGSLDEIVRLLDQDVPLVPLMYGPSIVSVQWKVKGYEPTPFGSHYFADVDLDA